MIDTFFVKPSAQSTPSSERELCSRSYSAAGLSSTGVSIFSRGLGFGLGLRYLPRAISVSSDALCSRPPLEISEGRLLNAGMLVKLGVSRVSLRCGCAL